MNRLKSILVGVDFSDCSRSALEQGARLAQRAQASLHVLHAVEYVTINDAAWSCNFSPEKLEQSAVASARESLRGWVTSCAVAAEAQVLVDAGVPIDCILRRARETAADLVVVGVTGSAMVPMGAGTLATKCLRKLPAKTLLVHERQSGPFRRIVTGVDFSEPSKEAAAQALLVASQDGSEVHFVHVFTGSWGRYALIPDAWEVNPALADQYRVALEERLREFVGVKPGDRFNFKVIEAGSHGHGMAEYARRIHADLVVLGKKGRSNLTYVLLGSTVERLLRELPCSALVVRPPTSGDSSEQKT